MPRHAVTGPQPRSRPRRRRPRPQQRRRRSQSWPRPRLLLAILAAVPLALAASGCGLGAGKAPSAIRLDVTSEFGARVLRSPQAPKVRGQETVMSLLMRNASVTTRYGGGFVQSVDGVSGGQRAGKPLDWFYYVNGVEASKGAAATNVNAGDHIWWDRHDWSQTDHVPAVVGAFPEPFLNGLAGKRLPVRVECASVGGYACSTVTARLRAEGVPAAIAAIGSGGYLPHTLRVAVAPWRVIANDAGVHAIESGPATSGVYARFAGASAGTTLTLLDEDGRSAQTLGAGGGLIAATRNGEDAPVWVVTGTDAAGMTSAARVFRAGVLADRFAVAVDASGPLALPRPGI
jgi:hypothetical protein